ncbi:hypothetical protein GGF32_003273 [Allomyces javanicus]|nr:hypothetical protein GGF32_003273 [Allomyces javanicus]
MRADDLKRGCIATLDETPPVYLSWFGCLTVTAFGINLDSIHCPDTPLVDKSAGVSDDEDSRELYGCDDRGMYAR